MGARLIAVDLLQGEDVGVQGADRRGQAVEIHLPVVLRPTVQDVESGQPHGKKVSAITVNEPAEGGDDIGLRGALKRAAESLAAAGLRVERPAED